MTPEEFGIDVEGFDFEGIDPSVAESPLGGLDVSDALGPIATVVPIVSLVLLIVIVAAMWKIFKKAGKPGWAATSPSITLSF
jgi:hypothetical protein